MTSDKRLQRPGFGLSLDSFPPWTRNEDKGRFPHAIADFFATDGVTLREQRMLDFVSQVTDKPLWWEKINDEQILDKWRMEASGDEEQQRTSSAHLSHRSFNYCIQELRDKADYLAKHGSIHVLDTDATVVKTDVDVSDPFWVALKGGVQCLEHVPAALKDWHPWTDNTVLDLLHPSLFPLSYGKTRILAHGTVPRGQCAEFVGKGEVCPIPESITPNRTYTRTLGWGNSAQLNPWGTYQWLPAEVKLDENGDAKIESYINNLHPQRHSSLYDVLEHAVSKAVPLWNECLSWFHDRIRIRPSECGWDSYIAPTYPGFHSSDPGEDEDADDDEWVRQTHYHDWLFDHPDERMVLQPDVSQEYVKITERTLSIGGESVSVESQRIDLRSDFPGGLQVIFKLANIHLSPDQPRYGGSNWHVEGALNEHICATALFYYDSSNIADSYLEFRQHVNTEAMVMLPPQNEFYAVEDMYGIKNEGGSMQSLGRVLARPGRWIAFPNVLQHRIAPFALRDQTMPGHRKILAMFLVDPHIKILSTANVPPQRRDWWADEVRKIPPFDGLPIELFEQIIDLVDDFPIAWDEACKMREELMHERSRIVDEHNEVLESDTFFFCEH